MKGLVFRYLLDFLDERLGPEATERVIDRCDLSSGGAYAVTGAYPFSDMQQLVGAASSESGRTTTEILEAFGGAAGCAFARQYSTYFNAHRTLFDLLENIETHIHVEVKKLYPDAELPSLPAVSRTEDTMVLHYRSQRRLHDFAKGVIHAAAARYDTPVEVTLEEIDPSEPLVAITVRTAPT